VKFLLKVCELASVPLTVDKAFTFNITDVNDETPSDITSTGNLNIAENTSVNTNLVTLSATDADVGDTFTYTLVNNSAAYFAIDGNTLKLAKTVDYETTKNLNITVRVTDVNSHTFDKAFTFNITVTVLASFSVLPSIAK
jgi:hypothetical protein